MGSQVCSQVYFGVIYLVGVLKGGFSFCGSVSLPEFIVRVGSSMLGQFLALSFL